jgi:hypothetical protein
MLNTSTLPPRQIERIGQLLRLALSTTAEAEAVSALTALRKTMARSGLDLHQITAALETGLQPPPPEQREPKSKKPKREAAMPDWRQQALFCDQHRDALSESEKGLITTLLRWRGTPTPKQVDWLTLIVTRLQRTY